MWHACTLGGMEKRTKESRGMIHKVRLGLKERVGIKSRYYSCAIEQFHQVTFFLIGTWKG